MELLQEKYESIDWYISYFSEDTPASPLCVPYLKHFSERYILACDVENGNEADAYLRFNELKNHSCFQNLDCYLWHVYTMKFDAITNGRFSPEQLGFFLRKKPKFSSPYVITIPEGNYICFKCHMRKSGWDSELFLRTGRIMCLPVNTKRIFLNFQILFLRYRYCINHNFTNQSIKDSPI